jgi:glutathione reductase (NADPH)
VSGNEVQVERDDGGNERIRSDHILIATGGHPKFLRNIEGWELGISSDGFFSLESQPNKVVIVGAGYIAIEMAGMFHALGTETHIFVQEGILLPFDEMIQKAVWDEYSRIGIKFYPRSSQSKVEDIGQGWKRMHYKSGDKTGTIDCDCLLWAIGRAPEVDDLNLQEPGVRLSEKGAIEVDEQQNTNVQGIYSVGDVCGKVQLTPVAIAAGRTLADRLFGNSPESRLDYHHIPSVVFAHPEVGTFGLSEAGAKEKHGEDQVKSYVSHFSPTYFSVLPDEDKVKSVYKLVCLGADEKVVGVHIVGQGSSEIIQGFGLAVKMGAKKADFDDFVPVHPTSAEELTSMS